MRAVIGGVFTFYLAAFIGLIVITGLGWDRGALIGVPSMILPLCFVLLIVVGNAAVFLRLERTRRISAALAIAGIVYYTPLILPKAVQGTDAPDLRVATYNIAGKSRLIPAVHQWLRDHPQDIVLLQEPFVRADQISEVLDLYPYQIVQKTAAGYRGNIVLSRYPFLETSGFALADEANPDNLTRVVIEVEGVRIAVYNISLPTPINREVEESVELPGVLDLFLAYDDRNRNERLENLLSVLEAEPLPFIAAGDFNMTDTGWGYEAMTAIATDSFREAGTGLGATFPAAELPIPPILRIDYIFHSDGLRTIRAELGENIGSDHLPVLAVLEIEIPADAGS